MHTASDTLLTASQDPVIARDPGSGQSFSEEDKGNCKLLDQAEIIIVLIKGKNKTDVPKRHIGGQGKGAGEGWVEN